MIRVIETDKGNFGKFIDILRDMQQQSYDCINISNITLIDGHNVAMVRGRYTLKDIRIILYATRII